MNINIKINCIILFFYYLVFSFLQYLHIIHIVSIQLKNIIQDMEKAEYQILS